MSNWGSTKIQTYQDKPKLDELVQVYKLPDKEYVSVRAVGPVFAVAEHWIPTSAEEAKKKNNRKAYPKVCLDYDSTTQSKVDNGCPYCKYLPEYTARVRFFANFIVRDEQKNEPRKKPKPMSSEMKKTKMLGYECFLKNSASKTWTPVFVVSMSPSLAEKIQGINALNKVKTKDGSTKVYDIDHPKYGCDITIRYNSKGTGTGMFDVSKEGKSSLTDEELEYPINKLDNEAFKVETKDVAKVEAKKALKRLSGEGGGDDDDDDDLKKIGKDKKKKHKSEDDGGDNDSEDLNEDFADLSSEEASEEKTKNKKKPKKKSEESEEASSEENSEDSEEGSEEAGSEEDSEEGSEEDASEEASEDRKPSKKSSKKKARKASEESEEASEESEEASEEASEESEEKHKFSKKKSSKKKSSRDAVDELDD